MLATGFTNQAGEVAEISLSAQGTIPNWLNGDYVRTGPAKFDFAQQSVNHWFDGMAALCKLSFQNGQVKFTTKFLQSLALQKAEATGHMCLAEFATNPNQQSLIEKLRSIVSPNLTDNGNVNIGKLNNHCFAMTETAHQIEFDLNSLNTSKQLVYDDNLKLHINTAHPHYDFEKHILYNVAVRISKTSKYVVYSCNNNLQRKVIAEIAVKEPGYIHSFAVTQNYIVIVESPLLLNPLELLFSGKPYITNYHWQPKKTNRFLFIDKNNGNLKAVIESQTCFVFHHINAYENGNEVIIDELDYADPSIIDSFYLDKIKSGNSTFCGAKFNRHTINLERKAISSQTLHNSEFEFPRINYKQHNAKNYRYAYFAARESGREFLNQMAKLDLSSAQYKIWQEENCFPGEPIFVHKANSALEDDGVLLSIVLNTEEKKSFLLVLAANTMEELARIDLPIMLPFGLHGQFFAHTN